MRRLLAQRGLPLLLACAIGAALADVRNPASAAVKEPSQVPARETALLTKRPLLAVTSAGARLVAVGPMGHIAYSDDQGRSWVQAAVPVSVDLTSVSFVTPRLGWVTGHDGVVLRSDDAGATWGLVLEGRQVARLLVEYYAVPARVSSPAIAAALQESRRFQAEGGARPFLDVWFKDERYGFVVGAWGLILNTSDGGKTWTPWLDRTDNPNSGHLYAVRPVDGHVWIVGEQGFLLRLDDAGQRFVAVLPPQGGSLFGVTGKSGLVMAYGLVGRKLVSRDGGRTWAEGGATGSSGITGVSVLSDGSIVAVDTGAGIWLSKDDGKSFVPLHSDKPMSYFGVTAADARTLVLVGSAGVRRELVTPATP